MPRSTKRPSRYGPAPKGAYSGKDFAALCGVTPGAITQAIAKRRIIRDADGWIYPTVPENAEYIRVSKERAQEKDKDGRGVVARGVENARVEQQIVRERLECAENPETLGSGVVPAEYVGTKQEFEIRKIISQTSITNAKLAETLGILVKRDMVDAVFAKFGTFIAGQLMTMGDRLSSEVGSIFGSSDPGLVAKTKAAIDRDVSSVLETMKSIISGELEKASDAKTD